MAEATDTGRFARFEDRRMWRLLLARLHPDAGGDHELFTFACAVKEELLGAERATPGSGRDEGVPRERGQHSPDLFLRTWQDAMNRWSSSNDDTLRGFGSR